MGSQVAGVKVDDDGPTAEAPHDDDDNDDDVGGRGRLESRQHVERRSVDTATGFHGILIDDDNDININYGCFNGLGLNDFRDYNDRIYYNGGGDDDGDVSCHPIHRRHYCCPQIQSKCLGNIYIAFLSHGCFVIASLAYVKLSYVELSWLQYALIYNDVPYEMLNEDDDATWRSWVMSNQGRYAVQSYSFDDARREYYDEYTTYCTWGATFFVFVGVLDYLRYWDTMNAYMVLAGFAGMLSGWSTNNRTMAMVWECVSVHLYLLESYNLLNRDHYHHHHQCRHDDKADHRRGGDDGDGLDDRDENQGTDDRDDKVGVTWRWHSIFYIGDVLFLVGSIMDVMGSYLGVLGIVGLWVGYADLIACYLWLGCSIMNWMAEIYFLRRQLVTSMTTTTASSTMSVDDYYTEWEIQCY
ncbi:hypothetical protein ACHAXA_000917 [Cyclostephanos tholiformis]|jgi:hypothetical protein|uniref:Uncharacterized protein n=1 Tax=Cyclostephanos tholiformis TaxID=382380 RepID=A0ABD3RMH1_9STRA